MTKSASRGDGPQLPSLPAPAALARWLLAAETGEQPSPDTFAAAAERAYLRLRERLAVLFGSTGFDTLWARALYLAQLEFDPADDTTIAQALATRPSGLPAFGPECELAVLQHNLEAVFTHFISLLCTFIGPELGIRFIRQIWPNLPPDAAESRAEKATP